MGFFLLIAGQTLAENRSKTVVIAEFKAPITPVVSRYIERVADAADKKNVQCLIIKMDTPGGLDSSMRDIIQNILASKTPVVVYVAPQGARAASAGMLITIASDVAAMAPGTNIGAAHPVSVGGGDSGSKTMEKKILNDSVAYARSLAESKKINVEFAEDAVRGSASISAEQALKSNVIEIIADNEAQLLEKLNGIKTKNKTIRTENAEIVRSELTWREKFLMVLADPNIAYLLMILGGLGIVFEISNPGAIVPGVIGALSIILAFVSFQVIPFNLAGFLLIILALILLGLEAHIVSYGGLTLGGIAAFILGSFFLVDTSGGNLRVSLPTIIISALATGLFFAFIVSAGLRAQAKKVITGSKGLIGLKGTARTDISPKGQVFVDGALWQAVSGSKIRAGKGIVVLDISGLTLTVEEEKE